MECGSCTKTAKYSICISCQNSIRGLLKIPHWGLHGLVCFIQITETSCCSWNRQINILRWKQTVKYQQLLKQTRAACTSHLCSTTQLWPPDKHSLTIWSMWTAQVFYQHLFTFSSLFIFKHVTSSWVMNLQAILKNYIMEGTDHCWQKKQTNKLVDMDGILSMRNN